MFVTRKTLNRLESGDPGVSMSVLAAALLTLGLESDLEKLANPEMDNTGNIIDREKYAKIQRIRQQKKIDMGHTWPGLIRTAIKEVNIHAYYLQYREISMVERGQGRVLLLFHKPLDLLKKLVSMLCIKRPEVVSFFIGN